ncbi:MAG: galactose oxidase early set domain-containing protein [Armatimonadota bacterium]|nr:galactose oxidase early set domain-containing protein [Armatimonadota bacterium]
MKNRKTIAVCAAISIHAVLIAQGSWSPLITPANGGWANLPDPLPADPTTYRAARAIHMIHIRPVNPAMGSTGKLLFWGRNNAGSAGVRPFVWDPFDLTNPLRPYGTFVLTSNQLGYEAFCCGQSLMADGKVLIAGSNFTGTPSEPGRQVAIYDPATNSWLESPINYQLVKKRYYPTVTRLPGGRMVVSGGQATDPPPPAQPAFVTEPYEVNYNTVDAQATWQMLVLDDYDLLNYPHMYPVSATEMFFAGPSRHHGGTYVNGWLEGYPTFFFDTAAGGDDAGRTLFGGLSQTWHGSTVMLGSMLLKSGGLSRLSQTIPYAELPATDQAESLPIGNMSTDPAWTFVAPMNHARIDHNLVVLPNEKVLALGGSLFHRKLWREDPANWVRDAEIWNRDTNVWTNVADPDPNTFRGYHSTAMLLPDGRVVLAGCDHKFDIAGEGDQPPSAQIYTPNYGVGTRPQITSGPDIIQVGSTTNSIGVNDVTVSKAVLIALGAVTHSFDMNQRYVEIELTNTLNPLIKNVKGPVSSTQAPVGWYMLFVLKPDGTGNMLPCQLAKYVKVISGSR